MAKKKTLKQRFPNAQMRLTNNLVDEFQRLSKNAKAKIKRIEKNYGDKVVIVGEDGEPKEVKTNELFDLPSIEEFSSRKKFNEWVDKQQHFINSGNYKFSRNDWETVASKNVIHKLERENKISQRMARRKIEELENKEIMNKQGETIATVGQRLEMMKEPVTGVTVPADFDFSKIRGNKYLLKKAESIRKRVDPEHYDKREQRMMENYIGMLKDFFNSDADKYIKELSKLTPHEFFDMYLTYLHEMDFDIYYTTDGMYEQYGKNGQLQTLEGVLERYKRGDQPSFRNADF